jgi:hypothetical protein
VNDVVFRYGAEGLALGALAALVIAAALAWRWLRYGESYEKWSQAGVLMATAFTAEGMWEVTGERLDLAILPRLVLFAMFEVVMVSQGLMAKHKIKDRPAAARRHMTFVWLIAAASGAITTLNAENVVEFGLRLVAPIVAAGLWWMSVTADLAKPADAITWKITPRRLLVRFGLAEAGEADLVQVNRERAIRDLARVGLAVRQGGQSPRRLRKLRRLALVADAPMVDEAVARVDRCDAVVTRMTRTPKPEPKKRAEETTGRHFTEGAESFQDANGRARKAASNGHAPKERRTVAEWMSLYEALRTDQPAAEEKDLAKALGLSERGLRDVKRRARMAGTPAAG